MGAARADGRGPGPRGSQSDRTFKGGNDLQDNKGGIGTYRKAQSEILSAQYISL